MKQTDELRDFRTLAYGYWVISILEKDVNTVFGGMTSLWTRETDMRFVNDTMVLSFRYRVIEGLDVLFAGIGIIRIGVDGVESITLNDITTSRHLITNDRDSEGLWKRLKMA